jgi:hypothetical protein
MQAVAQFVHVPLRSRLCFHLRLLHLCGRRGREHDHRLGDERREQQGLVLVLAVWLELDHCANVRGESDPFLHVSF